MDALEPQWAPEQHLDRVVKRGRQLRRRRRVLTGAGPVLAAVLAFSVVGLSRTETTSSVHTVAQGHTGGSNPVGTHPAPDGGDSSATSGTQAGDTSAPTELPPSAAAQPATARATAPDNSSSTGNQAGTPNGQPSQGSQGSPGSQSPGGQPGPSPQTAAPVASSQCASSDLSYTTVTDRASYARGQQVAISLVVTNHANRPCDAPSVCGVGPWASIVNRTGNVVWRSNPIAVACTNPPPAPPRLAPGQSTSYGAGTWDQSTCTSSACPGPLASPGTYRAIAHRGSTSATATRFTLTG